MRRLYPVFLLLILFGLTGCSGMPDDYLGHWALLQNKGATELYIGPNFMTYVTSKGVNKMAYEYLKKDESTPGAVLVQFEKEKDVGVIRKLTLAENGKTLSITLAGDVIKQAREFLPPSVFPKELYNRVDDLTEPKGE